MIRRPSPRIVLTTTTVATLVASCSVGSDDHERTEMTTSAFVASLARMPAVREAPLGAWLQAVAVAATTAGATTRGAGVA